MGWDTISADAQSRAGSLDAVGNDATTPCKVPHKALNRLSAHTDQTCIPDKVRGSSSPPIWANQCIVCSAEHKFEDIPDSLGAVVQIKLRFADRDTGHAISAVIVVGERRAIAGLTSIKEEISKCIAVVLTLGLSQ